MNWISQSKCWLLWATAAATLLVTVVSTAVPLAQGGQDDYAVAWGPSLNAPIPLLAASDQNGELQDLASLTGENGLLVLFNRSAVW